MTVPWYQPLQDNYYFNFSSSGILQTLTKTKISSLMIACSWLIRKLEKSAGSLQSPKEDGYASGSHVTGRSETGNARTAKISVGGHTNTDAGAPAH